MKERSTESTNRGNGFVRKSLSAAICSVALLTASVAVAQDTQGTIRGVVQGASSNTVVEVVSTSRGTTRSEATDASGEFDISGLPPGSYEIRVMQNGAVVDTLNVTVSLGAATSVRMATSETVINEIVATGRRMASVDTGIAESGLVINTELLLELPVRRDLTSVALLAPGASLGDNRFGGANVNAKGNSLASFGGASVAENTSFINGLNTTNFRTGVGFTQVPFEFYDTIQVKTGGYSAKFGRSTGGVMNATTKSGSNEWDFGFNAYYDDELETSPDTFRSANALDINEKTTYDVYASGPIIEDRLFFYALYSDVDNEQRYAGIESGRDQTFTVDEGFWGVKLDGYITPDHHLEYTHFTDERTGTEEVYSFDPATYARGAYLGDTVFEEGGENWIASYTGQFGPDIEVALSYGENEANRTTAPATADIPVVYEYQGGFVAIGDWTNFTVSKGRDKREMFRADFTYTGFNNHEISFGIDNEDNFSDEATVNSGGVYWLRDPTNAYNSCDVATECPQGANARRRNYSVGGSFSTFSEAYYIQDVWQVTDQLTFELGLRNESFENLNAEGGVFVAVEDQWAPRLAAVFDPVGDGRQKLFANWGEYYLPIAANTNIRMAGNETYIHDFYDWDGTSVDGQGVPTGLGPIYRSDVFGDGTVPDTRSVADANLDAMYQEEFILGYQWTLDNDIQLSIKGIERKLATSIEDVAIDAAVIDYYNSNGGWDYTGGTVEDVFSGFHQYVLTNPGEPMRVYIPETDETINLTASQLGYDQVYRDYRAIELTANRPLADGWTADLSYTYAISKGNHEGYVKSDNGQDDAGITTNFDQPGLVDFSNGRLPNDRTHTFKAWGSYQFDNGLSIGTNLLWQSGRPISCFGEHPTDLFAQEYGAASHYCQGQAVPRGSLGRTDNIKQIDLSAQYNFDFGNAGSMLLSLDVFNVFNFDSVTRVHETGDTASGAPDEDFLKPVSYQLPRSLRLTARYNF